MKGKITVFALCAMLFALCPPVSAQQPTKVPRLGYLSGGSSHTGTNPNAFWQGLRELGYVEGKNIRFEYGLAERKLDGLPVVAAKLVGLKVDIIVAVGGTEPALAAKQATKTIPIVFTSVSDPVSAGLVESLARPGGNITGLTNIGPELSGNGWSCSRKPIPSSPVWLFCGIRNIQAWPWRLRSHRQRPEHWGFSSNHWRCGVLGISRVHSKPQLIGTRVLFTCRRLSFLTATGQSWPSSR